MSNAQRQIHPDYYPAASPLNPGSAQPATRRRVAPRTAAAIRQIPETAQVALISVLALAVFVVGVLYLGCCARVAHEAVTRVRLRSELRQEHEIEERMWQAQSEVAASETVERSAMQYGMAPGSDQETVTIYANR